ncbi:MAG: sulfatase-like hydrolase/transferase [Myxococcota bacterium]|nr:sulfatase-like hydrolase/transferase [Myxococcota bacterium]
MSNVLLVLTDQSRDVGPWDGDALRAFREGLPTRRRLDRAARRFRQHRTASAACVPSRVSLFTGTSPWVHGVSQTDGMAKEAGDQGMTWLSPQGVPTLGHRLQAAGHETVYIGKWHLSHPADGRLEPWGFHGWQGPEPHGADPANSGVSRDPGFVQQAEDWLRARAAGASEAPFFLVVSLVNPHDIVFWPAWSLWARRRLALEGIPALGPGPSAADTPTEEPSTLRAYREHYLRAYAPPAITRALYAGQADRYRRFYASLLSRVDAHVGSLLDTLEETGLAADTHVVVTSDHGELLGAHGGLHQKFYNAFEETLRVPLWIRYADGRYAGNRVETPTDHLDLAPTLLGLAGVDPRQPPGRGGGDGWPALRGRDLSGSIAERDSYFVTLDSILDGESRQALVGRALPWLGARLPLRYGPLPSPNPAVECVVAGVPDATGRPEAWKLIRYFHPSRPAGAESDEWSLYRLDADPCERSDLSRHAASHAVLHVLRARLDQARRAAGGP